MSSNDDFQRRAVDIGKRFHDECRDLLSNLGFEYVDENHPINSHGVEIEFIFNNLHDNSLFFDACGTDEDKPTSDRPGFVRTDNVKKTITNGFLISRATGRPIIALTSHVPQPDSASSKMLDMAGRRTILDVICVYDPEDMKRLKRYLDMKSEDLDKLTIDDERPLW